MRNMIPALFLFCLIITSACTYQTKRHTRPNILYIMCDDLTEQAIGCYGYSYNRTPAMDKLADQGRCIHPFVCNQFHLRSFTSCAAYRKTQSYQWLYR